MVPRNARLVDPNDPPLVVTPMTTDGPQPWHQKALELRANNYSVRAIAKLLGKGYGPTQRLLNQESKRQQKLRSVEYERERRAADPEYAQKMRDYNRRYHQTMAPNRWVRP